MNTKSSGLSGRVGDPMNDVNNGNKHYETVSDPSSSARLSGVVSRRPRLRDTTAPAAHRSQNRV
jgi:hypothetical protein